MLFSGYKVYLITFIAIFVICFAQSKDVSAQGDDWIVLIDTSRSMIGEGDDRRAENIFPQVKEIAKDFIKSSDTGDALYLFTFDAKPTFQNFFTITAETNKSNWAQLIDNYEGYIPKGDYTHIAEAIIAGVNRANKLGRPDSDPRRNINIILFTDGLENTSDNPAAPTLASIPARLVPSTIYPFTITVIWLGEGGEEVKKRVQQELVNPLGEQAKLLFAPRAKDYKNITGKIHNIIPPKLIVEPSSLDFGYVEPNSTTQKQELTITSDRDATIQLSLSQSSSSAITLYQSNYSNIKLRAGNSISIPLVLQSAPSTPDILCTGSLSFTYTEEISDTLPNIPSNIITPPLTFKVKISNPSWSVKYSNSLLLIGVLLSFVSISLLYKAKQVDNEPVIISESNSEIHLLSNQQKDLSTSNISNLSSELLPLTEQTDSKDLGEYQINDIEARINAIKREIELFLSQLERADEQRDIVNEHLEILRNQLNALNKEREIVVKKENKE